MNFFIPCASLETPQGIVANLDGRGLTIEWSIARDNTNRPDSGTITIYNLAPALALAIHAAWLALKDASGYLVSFSIGWNSIPRRVLVGDVVRMTPNRKSGTDLVTTLEIGDGVRQSKNATIVNGFKSVSLDIVLDWLVQLPPNPADAGGGGLGLLYPPESRALIKAASSALGVQAFNLPPAIGVHDAITMIMETLGLSWRVQNGAFIAMRGGLINRPGFVLSASTGLLDYAPRDDGGCVLQALGNPEIEPGIQVIPLDPFGRPFAAPAYRVEKVNYQGTTKAESVMTIEGAPFV